MDEIKLLKRKRKAEGNNKLLVSICTDLAELYMNKGQFQQAVDEYKTLANIHLSDGNQIEYATANRGIGEAYLGLNNFRKALEHQKLYLDIVTAEKNQLEIQRAYATIGHIYLSTYLETTSNPEMNLNAAYKHFMKSMKLCESLTGINKLEKADMQARLLSNLGLVKESLGDYIKAIELFTASITICKNNDIYEQLYRGYVSMATLYDKKGDSGKSMHNFNLAVDAAKKIKGNTEFVCAALLQKSIALIKLGDFHTAKKHLYKAYKRKTSNLVERKSIEKCLRTVVRMCRTEDQIVIGTNDTRELKRLYEIMGDCACSLKNYSKALEYYKLMLTNAEKSGISGKELATCYYSLAETYTDNKMYKEAVDFFEKEYMLSTDLKDNLNTLSKIADTKELAGCSVKEVKSVYDRAFINCRNDNNLKEERRMIGRCIAYLRRSKSESDICQLEKQLNSIYIPPREEESSSSGSDGEGSESNDDKENDVDLSDITDLSEDSDLDQNPENEAAVATGKRRSKSFVMKKNAKGESQLHVACINGKVPVVKHLLDQGHPVNVRDNTGWLPIHEACNYGYYEIAKLLIDKGAAINDRGGIKCEGITPIFDASFNGHLKVVELLLNKGASVAIKTDNGNTPLNALKLWHQNNPFTGEEYTLYLKIIERMSAALKKIGHSVSEEVVTHKQLEEDSEEQFMEDILSEKSDDNDSESTVLVDTDSRRPSPNLLNEYQEIMRNLGNKSSKATCQNKRFKSSRSTLHQNNLDDDWLEDDMYLLKDVSGNMKCQDPTQSVRKPSALVEVNDSIDDWLEDDMQSSKTTKKRKTSSIESVVTSSVWSNSSPRNSSPLKRLSEENIRLLQEDVVDITTTSPSPVKQRIDTDNQNPAKRKFQASLLDAGFNKTSTRKTKTPSSTIQRHRSLDYPVKQQKITTFGTNKSFVEPDSTVSQPVLAPVATQIVRTQEPVAAAILTGDLMVYVDVNIEDKVFRVPVLLSQIQGNTIGWLADQAAQKYARKECSKPCLELETTSGALLCDEDPLSLLFPLGATQAETVVGRIIKLYMTPLVERYKEACSHMKEDINETLITILEEVSVKLNLENKGFSSITLSPLCKSLNHQTTLLDLDLSGNFLDISCMTILCGSLPSLLNISSLNLRCTGLTSNHLAELVKLFTLASHPILEKLKLLDISNNYLRNRSFRHLADITKHLKLESLNMSNIALNKDLFKEIDVDLKLQFQDLRSLDISDNQLNTLDVERFISWTTVTKLSYLNVSKNIFTDFRPSRDIENVRADDFTSLKYLLLSRSGLHDNDVNEILRMCSGKLVEIDLSYNSELTGITLRRLLEYAGLETIKLIGCDNIFQYFSEYANENPTEIGAKFIKISADLHAYHNQVNNLIFQFKNMYQQHWIEQDHNLLLMYSKELYR